MHILEMNFTILILINYEHDTFVYYIDTIKICLFDISLYCVGTPDMFDISLLCWDSRSIVVDCWHYDYLFRFDIFLLNARSMLSYIVNHDKQTWQLNKVLKTFNRMIWLLFVNLFNMLKKMKNLWLCTKKVLAL